MCIAQPKVIAAPQVAPAPTRATASASANSLLNETRNLVARRQGIFGNIKTTPLGDASYGTSVARF